MVLLEAHGGLLSTELKIVMKKFSLAGAHPGVGLAYCTATRKNILRFFKHYFLFLFQVGVEIAARGGYPEDPSVITTQTRHFITSDPDYTRIMGTAELKKDGYSTLVFYQCIDTNTSP